MNKKYSKNQQNTSNKRRDNKTYNKNNFNKSQKQNNNQASDIPVIQHTLKNASKSAKYKRKPYRGRYKNYQSKTNNLEKIFKRYDYLIELHVKARKKYFENHYIENMKILNRLEKNFNHTLNQIKEFVDNLTEVQKKAFNNKYNSNPEDTKYSENHGLNKLGEIKVSDYQITDPHILSTQKSTDFSKDKEESVGTLEDYNKFKNN